MKNSILITGANGQLGQEFRALSPKYPQYYFLFATRDDLSISDQKSIRNYFKETKPSYCINCAAYTAVDKAESEKEQATLINGDAPGWMAEICEQYGTKFIHISTDYVFDGTSAVPYKENDPTNPVNHYGLSKLIGEREVMENNPDAIIIRTSWVYSAFGNNFVKTMMRLMKERESINVVADQTGSPTYAVDLAEAIMQIIISKKKSSGIFNYSNEGRITWYDFALAIKELIHSNCKVNPISTAQYPTPAKRPAYSLLDKTKIRKVFSIEIPGWRESLARCVERLQVVNG